MFEIVIFQNIIFFIKKSKKIKISKFETSITRFVFHFHEIQSHFLSKSILKIGHCAIGLTGNFSFFSTSEMIYFFRELETLTRYSIYVFIFLLK